jgi:hypothetical protein
MKYLKLLVLTAVLVPSVALAGDDSLAFAERAGTMVVGAIHSKDTFELSQLHNYKQIKNALSQRFCSALKYRYYRIGTLVYVIGFSPSGVVIGRNFKFRIDSGRANVASLTASTKSCAVIKSDPRSAGLFVTHILSDQPTEFHVIASLLAGKPIYVGTRTGIWKVSGANISLLKRRGK